MIYCDLIRSTLYIALKRRCWRAFQTYLFLTSPLLFQNKEPDSRQWWKQLHLKLPISRVINHHNHQCTDSSGRGFLSAALRISLQILSVKDFLSLHNHISFVVINQYLYTCLSWFDCWIECFLRLTCVTKSRHKKRDTDHKVRHGEGLS